MPIDSTANLEALIREEANRQRAAATDFETNMGNAVAEWAQRQAATRIALEHRLADAKGEAELAHAHAQDLQKQLDAAMKRIAELESQQPAEPEPGEPVPPAPVEPPAVTATMQGNKVRLTIEPQTVPVSLYIRSKAAKELVKVLSPGETTADFHPTEAIPYQTGWELWAWAQHGTQAGPETRIVVTGPGKPAEPPDIIITDPAVPPGYETFADKDVTGLRSINRKIALINCTMRSQEGGWQKGHGLYYEGGDILIRGLRAKGDARTGNALIAGYRGNFTMEDSLIDGGWQGIHIIGRDGHKGRVIIRRTRFIHGHRYPIELQSGFAQVLLEDLDVRDYLYVYRDSGLSIATVETDETILRRILHIADPAKGNPSRPDSYEPLKDPNYSGVGGRYGPGAEVAGKVALVEDCEFRGPFVKVLSILSGHGKSFKTHCTIRRNKGCGWRTDLWGTRDPVVRDGGSVIVNDWQADNEWREKCE